MTVTINHIYFNIQQYWIAQ